MVQEYTPFAMPFSSSIFAKEGERKTSLKHPFTKKRKGGGGKVDD